MFGESPWLPIHNFGPGHNSFPSFLQAHSFNDPRLVHSIYYSYFSSCRLYTKCLPLSPFHHATKLAFRQPKSVLQCHLRLLSVCLEAFEPPAVHRKSLEPLSKSPFQVFLMPISTRARPQLGHKVPERCLHDIGQHEQPCPQWQVSLHRDGLWLVDVTRPELVPLTTNFLLYTNANFCA